MRIRREKGRGGFVAVGGESVRGLWGGRHGGYWVVEGGGVGVRGGGGGGCGEARMG
jgi:hypothetical protein